MYMYVFMYVCVCVCVCVCVILIFFPFFELSLTATIMVLTSASWYYMTSLNYHSKKARDVGLTCRCHLSNVMLDSVTYDSAFQGTTCLFIFLFLFVCFFLQWVVTTIFLRLQRDGCSVLPLWHQCYICYIYIYIYIYNIYVFK